MALRWSIIICTHNRAQDLQEMLPRYNALSYPRDQYELVVVDNASSDATPDVVKAAQETLTNLRYVREDSLGLSHARNRGIMESRGDFIAFIDDDAWPEPEWLSALDEAFKAHSATCVGGMVKPVRAGNAPWPQWLHSRHVCFFTAIEETRRKKLTFPDCPVGTNIAFRKSVLREIGGFNPELGRIGQSLLSGEEAELCLRIEDKGYDVLYTPEAVVHHKVHEARLNKEWVLQRSFWQGVSIAVIDKQRSDVTTKLSRSLKYSCFFLVGAAAKRAFSILGNERMSFFCGCQIELCRAYLSAVWRPSTR